MTGAADLGLVAFAVLFFFAFMVLTLLEPANTFAGVVKSTSVSEAIVLLGELIVIPAEAKSRLASMILVSHLARAQAESDIRSRFSTLQSGSAKKGKSIVSVSYGISLILSIVEKSTIDLMNLVGSASTPWNWSFDIS